jgi:hypothetical protein
MLVLVGVRRMWGQVAGGYGSNPVYYITHVCNGKIRPIETISGLG